MPPFQKENKLIHKLSGKILTTADFYFTKTNPIIQKSHPNDVCTIGDAELDALISKKIARVFPKDIIVSEESTGHLFPKLLQGERGWVIDPLCGSMNFARHIRQFCTNIALVENKQVVAAWVVDHANRSLIWSVGENAVYVNKTKIKPETPATWLIDMDEGYWAETPASVKEKYAGLFAGLMREDQIIVVNIMSSLGFTYVATGQFQAAFVPLVKPWDLLAACFLVEQSGGKVTYFDGSAWGISSTQAMMAADEKIYNAVYRLVRQIGLDNT